MALARLFYTKIINGEDKEDEAPFVAPKSRGGGGLVFAWWQWQRSGNNGGNKAGTATAKRRRQVSQRQ